MKTKAEKRLKEQIDNAARINNHFTVSGRYHLNNSSPRGESISGLINDWKVYTFEGVKYKKKTFGKTECIKKWVGKRWIHVDSEEI